jgi:hypothetical protein
LEAGVTEFVVFKEQVRGNGEKYRMFMLASLSRAKNNFFFLKFGTNFMERNFPAEVT